MTDQTKQRVESPRTDPHCESFSLQSSSSVSPESRVPSVGEVLKGRCRLYRTGAGEVSA